MKIKHALGQGPGEFLPVGTSEAKLQSCVRRLGSSQQLRKLWSFTLVALGSDAKTFLLHRERRGNFSLVLLPRSYEHLCFVGRWASVMAAPIYIRESDKIWKQLVLTDHQKQNARQYVSAAQLFLAQFR